MIRYKKLAPAKLKVGLKVYWRDPDPIEEQEYKKGVIVDIEEDSVDESIVYIRFDDGSEGETRADELFYLV